MEAILMSARGGHITETAIGKVSVASVSSCRASLTMYANRYFGLEGKDWRIVQSFDNRLVPFFVRSLSGDESEIHVQ